jgi:branched-chain amino acid transport system substrate-binding protein
MDHDPGHPSRRRILQTGAALAGASALGAPALLYAQAPASNSIRIGHLTPMTGFLGALGEYAVLGLKMAVEEINAAGGLPGLGGRPIDLMTEDSVNPQVAASKAQRMLERDNVAFLMGEINSASALTISQVAARNKKLFLSIGARSDALRGKDCNRYTFHVDIPVTVMVNAAGQALVREGLVKGKKIFSLTADYLFGHDLSRAAKRLFAANGGGEQIGDELVPPTSARTC